MKESTKKFWSTAFGIVFLFTFFIPIIPLAVIGIANGIIVTCTDKPIPYATHTEYDNTVSSDITYTRTAGVNGIEHICKNNNNDVKSDIVTLKPTDEVDVVGSYVAPTPDFAIPSITYSGGSTCMDGTHSNSTGRGTCSWRGGVAY